MKITNLQCPSCGGKLEPMKSNPKIVVCEYCKSQFMVEEDQPVNYHIHQYSTAPAGSVRTGPGSAPARSSAAAVAVAAVFVVLASAASILLRTSSSPTGNPKQETRPVSAAAGEAERGSAGETQETASPLCESAIKAIFGRSSSLVTEEDLSRIKYLRVSPGSQSATIEYSFQDPYADHDFQAVTLTLEPESWSSADLSLFTGLVKLDVTSCRDVISLKELTQLKELACSGLEISQIAGMVAQPEQILSLSLDNAKSLEGINVFENLETLAVEDIISPDLKQLVSLKNLTSLSITEDQEWDPLGTADPAPLTDYWALSVLTGLEELEVDSPCLRDLGFLKSLTSLTRLSLINTEIISLEPVAELSGLTSLKLEDNSSVGDYSPMGQLTGLTDLSIHKSTSQDDPDLSSLTGLERLDMSGFVSVSFLRNMGNLRQLSLHGCNIDEIAALSGLTNLESLTCYSVWTYAVPLRDVGFIDNMPNLRFLDFSGASQGNGWGGYQRNTEILGDISNVFNHQGLEELYLNNCMFQLDFEKLKENPTLQKLELREVKLKENFYVQSSGGVTDLWYDDVSLDEHTDFLANYPNLLELYLDGNQLTNIQFAASLKNLTHLGINNNYVTELSPLNQAESLRYLDIRQNPISATIEAGEDVQILR